MERVNLSNELVSYHQDTTCQKDGATTAIPPTTVTAWVQPEPHAVSPQQEDREELPTEERPVTTPTQAMPGSSPKCCHVTATSQLDCGADLSLETINAFTGFSRHEGHHHPIPEG